ncbi:MAG: hypothetical protein AAGJ54_06850 [Planctomycetota bacterium]
MKLPILVVVCALANSAGGQVLAVEQLYRIDPNPPGDDRSLRFFAAVDISGLSGEGTELAPIFRNFVAVQDLAGSTAQGRAQSNGSPYLDLPRNLRAEFTDGVFNGNIRQIDDPATTGTEYIIIRDDDGVFGGVFLIGPEFASWGPDVLNPRNYRIESTVASGSSEPSPADFDLNGIVDVFDLLRYLQLFDEGDATADLNDDQDLTTADVEIAVVRVAAVSP